MKKMVVAEDDVYLREEIMLIFEREGYSVTGISSFADAGSQIIGLAPDIVILDVNLPCQSGFELCKQLKSRASFPILILTARDTLTDELTALGLGADDFLTKPCHPKRLLARVKRLLQTYGKVKNVIQAGNLTLDMDTYKLAASNQEVVLPETEGKILCLLMREYPRTVSKAEIFRTVWGTETYVDENILQVNMTRLRRNLLKAGLSDCIKTVRGHGYCLEEKDV